LFAHERVLASRFIKTLVAWPSMVSVWKPLSFFTTTRRGGAMLPG
jgi:hypothetical protein